MKRPEMREIIRRELLKTVDGDVAKHVAENILFLIEKPACVHLAYLTDIVKLYLMFTLT